jgi:2-oxoisovalerate dehydrogenase E1 component beta subunit
VLDLRSLTPLDREAILESVKRTNKVLIVHEDTLTGGIGAELAAILAEDLFEYLDGPITRVAAPDAPFPYAPPLEAAYLPNEEKILTAARQLAAY